MSDWAPCRVLFLCRHNRMRSPTAERIFSKRTDLEVRSAGTASDALARVNAQMLDWADLIFIMDDQQRRSLRRRFAGHLSSAGAGGAPRDPDRATPSAGAGHGSCLRATDTPN